MNVRFFRTLLALALLSLPLVGLADSKPLRFAWLSDTHVGDPTGAADLRNSVNDINSQPDLAFVIVSGDVTQFGSHEEFTSAKSIFDDLRIHCYATPGNHDCKWSESGATEFSKIWGDDRFVFDAGGYTFISMHEGPVMKMGDGHFSPQDVRWLTKILADLPKDQPIIFITHYPLDDQLDNWFVVLDLLKKYNIQAILVGHGHANKKLNFEGVPAAMGRSNLRVHDKVGGYTLCEINNGVLTIAERNPGVGTKKPWHTIKLEKHDFTAAPHHWPRPDFSINAKYLNVKTIWTHDTGWTIASTPAVTGKLAIVGDASGVLHACSLKDGEVKWEFKTGGPIYSTPEVAHHTAVFASTDGSLYAVKSSDGKKLWQFQTEKPEVASPHIVGKTVYIGASDGKFRALNLANGKLIWEFDGVGGFVETKPLVTAGKVIFGAWDQHLYALDAKTGKLLWKWMGKSPGKLGVMYSPAAYWPVAAKNKLFVVAPDRFMTALDLASGGEIWRTGEWQVRETIGLSHDESRFYVRTLSSIPPGKPPGWLMAFSTATQEPKMLWQQDAGFGYDINSASIVEKSGTVFYGTKNGLLLTLDAKTGVIKWQQKLGVTILNTVVPFSKSKVLVTDLDGKISLVEGR